MKEQKLIFVEHLQEIANNHNYFLIDVGYVVYNKGKKFDGVDETLINLRKLDKKIIFFSNSVHTNESLTKKLHKVGIDENWYDYILASAGVVHSFLEENIENGFDKVGKNYIYVGLKEEEGLLDDLPEYKRVSIDEINKADFVLSLAFGGSFEEVAEQEGIIKKCMEHNLPIVSNNPAKLPGRGKKGNTLNIVNLAKEYRKRGGKVYGFGKPFPEMYEVAFKLLNITTQAQKDKVLAIGDKLKIDMLGADMNNIDGAFVAGGTEGDDLGGIEYGEMPTREAIQKLCDRDNIYPKYIIPGLIW